MGIQINSSDALVVKHLNDPITNKTSNKAKNTAGKSEDTVNVGMKDIYKSLTVLADEITSKLNDILGEDAPEGGIASLNPEDFTPEKTADIIVKGTTAMMDIFAKQNPDLEGEELLDKFMKTIRGGIQEGYSQAKAILGGIGAFEFDGVEDGISKTMSLVEEKLKTFEDQWRKDNLASEETSEESAEDPESVQS